MMTNFVNYHQFLGKSTTKFFKSTLFQSPNILLGVNCLEPGQSQPVHTHEEQDKFYFVIEGEGQFTVGKETRTLGPGSVVFAPVSEPHGVVNNGPVPLVLLVGIAPSPGHS